MKKIIYVMLDGVAGPTVKEPEKRTLLESAFTPCMDKLARAGKTGSVRMIPDDGSVVFRVDLRAGHDLRAREISSLAREINTRVVLAHATFELKIATGGCGILILRAMHHELSPDVAFIDGASGHLSGGVKLLPGHEASPAAIQTAALLNEFVAKSCDVLSQAPADKKHVRLSLGAADGFWELLSMDGYSTGIEDVLIDAAHADQDAAAGAGSILKKIVLHDILCVRVMGLGGPGRHGPHAKRDMIEAIDRRFFGDLLAHLKVSDAIFAVVVRSGAMLVSGGRMKPDGSMSFSERACREGSLGTVSAKDLPRLLFKFAKEQDR